MSSKKTVIIISGFLAALALIGALLVFLTSQIKTEGQRLFETRQNLDSFLQNWKNLEKAKEESSAVENKLSQTDVFLKPEEAIKFILSVENFAQVTQNRESISVANNLIPRSQEEKPKENTLNFQILLSGSFPNLIKFLSYLENAPYLNNVDTLQITRQTDKDVNQTKDTLGGEPGDVKTTINLSVFEP